MSLKTDEIKAAGHKAYDAGITEAAIKLNKNQSAFNELVLNKIRAGKESFDAKVDSHKGSVDKLLETVKKMTGHDILAKAHSKAWTEMYADIKAG